MLWEQNAGEASVLQDLRAGEVLCALGDFWQSYLNEETKHPLLPEEEVKTPLYFLR